jgi:predicted alpha/beta-hydrolase family hydrolase
MPNNNPGMEQIKIHISDKVGEVSALWNIDTKSKYALILGHGAGAGMHHPFMSLLSEELLKRSVATLRYQFPYMEKGRKSPGSPSEAIQTIVAVLDRTLLLSELPVLLGGKSYGGRMASSAIAKYNPESVQGLVFYGFPLHAPGRPSIERAHHLSEIEIPMLFLQGEKDKLADIVLIKEVCKNLPKATLVPFDSADHSFRRPIKSGFTMEETMAQLAFSTSEWAANVDFK